MGWMVAEEGRKRAMRNRMARELGRARFESAGAAAASRCKEARTGQQTNRPNNQCDVKPAENGS